VSNGYCTFEHVGGASVFRLMFALLCCARKERWPYHGALELRGESGEFDGK